MRNFMRRNPDTEELGAEMSKHGYSIITMIGHGSYGNVYTVSSQRYPGTTFVAKVMRIPTNGKPEAERAQFESEIKILTNLCHLNVVGLFDHFECNDGLVMILEYCENGSLDSYLARNRLPFRQLVALFQQMLIALNHLHKQGIAHRDIKPGNVLIDKYGRAKLADFGLSCSVADMDGPKYAGSVQFMAPEIINIDKKADLFMADIWSLGVTFYTAAEGETPWGREADMRFLRRAVSGGLMQYPRTMKRELMMLLKKMIVIEPKRRATCEQLLEDPIFEAVDIYGKIHVANTEIKSAKTSGLQILKTGTTLSRLVMPVVQKLNNRPMSKSVAPGRIGKTLSFRVPGPNTLLTNATKRRAYPMEADNDPLWAVKEKTT